MWNNKENTIFYLYFFLGCSVLCYVSAQNQTEKGELTNKGGIKNEVEEIKIVSFTNNSNNGNLVDIDKKKHNVTTSTSSTISTTVKPTTSKTTTTEVPTTSTTTAKPSPTPRPSPDIGMWNSSCIRLQMASEVNFTYTTKDNKTSTGYLTVPSSAKVHDVECDKPAIQQMVLTWGTTDYPNFLTVGFEKNNESDYGLFKLLFNLQTKDLPNAKVNSSIQLLYNKRSFLTPLKMSYHCTRQQNLNLTSVVNNNEVVGVVSIMDLQFEAFHNGKKDNFDFSTAKDCEAMDTPDIVPIAVGIALIALILIVLISYLVARRRSTARGYMSF